MNDFLEYLLGNMKLGHWAATLVFSFLTALGMLMWKSTKRDPGSKTTPFCFSWRFLFTDNAVRFYSSIIFIIISIRLVQIKVSSEYMVYVSIAIGVLSDRLGALAEYLRDKMDSEARRRIRSKFNQKGGDDATA